MPINLSKGQKISLSKEAPGLKKSMVGLGWDTNKYDGGQDFDLDASAFSLAQTASARAIRISYFMAIWNTRAAP